jgi:hypothetical protein
MTARLRRLQALLEDHPPPVQFPVIDLDDLDQEGPAP